MIWFGYLKGFHAKSGLFMNIIHLQINISLSHNLLAKTVFTSGDPVLYSQQFVDSIGETIVDEPASPSSIEVYFEYKE